MPALSCLRGIVSVYVGSMIANSGLSGHKFGTGKLLEDLISFVFQGENCKLVLIGDTAQLPPVGEENCPALSKSALECLGLTVFNEEITQVVRQSAESGILYNATSIRNLLQNNHCHNIPRIKFNGFTDICRLSGTDLIESLNNSYYKVGEDETVVVCRSNKRANIYNNGIRFQVLDRENILCSGDRVIIAKNNYFWTEKIKEIEKKEDKLVLVQNLIDFLGVLIIEMFELNIPILSISLFKVEF